MMVLDQTSVIIIPEITVWSPFKAQFYLSMGMQLKVQAELGDAAQSLKYNHNAL